MLDDLAAYLGTVVIEEEKKHSFVNVTAEMLGRVSEADVTPHYTIFKGVRSDETKLAERIRILEEKLKLVKDPTTDPDKTLERLSLLNGKVYNYFNNRFIRIISERLSFNNSYIYLRYTRNKKALIRVPVFIQLLALLLVLL
jgi:hypothetical protein